MKLSKQQLADIFDDAADFDGSNEQAVYARKALLAGTLEIEGYIRADHFADAGKMGWTKFDPDKRDTYPPPKGKEFLAWGLPDPDFSKAPTFFVCWRSSFGFSCDASACPEIHFWRPLPPPPGKEEAK